MLKEGLLAIYNIGLVLTTNLGSMLNFFFSSLAVTGVQWMGYGQEEFRPLVWSGERVCITITEDKHTHTHAVARSHIHTHSHTYLTHTYTPPHPHTLTHTYLTHKYTPTSTHTYTHTPYLHACVWERTVILEVHLSTSRNRPLSACQEYANRSLYRYCACVVGEY